MIQTLAAVLEPSFLRKLDRLQVRVLRTLATRPGNTPMPQGSQPSGLELVRHKAYAPGDDLRHIDWNAFARLDEALIKTFRAEREAPLHLLLDCSASMGVPVEDGKLFFATALCAALAYISLRHYDPVRLVELGGRTEPFCASPLYRHPRRMPEIFSRLTALSPAGAQPLADAIDAYVRATRLPGVAVVISDFLHEPAECRSALGALLAMGCTVAALRILGPSERDPSRLGEDVRVHDVESGHERFVRLSEEGRRAYADALESHLRELHGWCASNGVLFACLDPTAGLESALFDSLYRAGLLR